MITEANKSIKTADKMKSVKVAWAEVPSGLKKGTAHKHYQAAEKAYAVKNDADTNKELNAAAHALA